MPQTDFSAGSGQSKPKTSWKGVTILGTSKNSYDSREELKTSISTGVWKTVIPTLVDNFEWFETLEEEVTLDMVETARELQLEVEPEDVTTAVIS